LSGQRVGQLWDIWELYPWDLLLHCLLSTLQKLRSEPAAEVWLQLLLNIISADGNAGAAAAGIRGSQLCKELLGCCAQTGSNKSTTWKCEWLLSASSITGSHALSTSTCISKASADLHRIVMLAPAVVWLDTQQDIHP
jgi:hypothetical protein